MYILAGIVKWCENPNCHFFKSTINNNMCRVFIGYDVTK
jgi:hypothetical protein